MKAMYSRSLAVASLLALLGCSVALRPAFRFVAVKHPAKSNDECKPLKYRKTGEGVIMLDWWMMHPHQSEHSYQYPAFDPQNPNQVVYGLHTNAPVARGRKSKQAGASFWLANLSTRQSRQVFDNDELFEYQVRPGSKDWLTYNTGGQTWSRSLRDGSRRQLTQGLRHQRPQWRFDGKQLVASEAGPEKNAFESQLMLLDSAGQRIPVPALEALTGVPGPWSPDGRWLLWVNRKEAGVSVNLYDFATGEARSVGSKPSGARPWYWYLPWVEAAWLPDSRSFVWCNSAGLFRTTLATKSTVLVRAGCERRIYEGVAVAPDGQRLVVQRADQRTERDSVNVYRETNLWTMNLDGSNERKLVFRGHRQHKAHRY